MAPTPASDADPASSDDASGDGGSIPASTGPCEPQQPPRRNARTRQRSGGCIHPSCLARTVEASRPSFVTSAVPFARRSGRPARRAPASSALGTPRIGRAMTIDICRSRVEKHTCVIRCGLVFVRASRRLSDALKPTSARTLVPTRAPFQPRATKGVKSPPIRPRTTRNGLRAFGIRTLRQAADRAWARRMGPNFVRPRRGNAEAFSTNDRAEGGFIRPMRRREPRRRSVLGPRRLRASPRPSVHVRGRLTDRRGSWSMDPCPRPL